MRMFIGVNLFSMNINLCLLLILAFKTQTIFGLETLGSSSCFHYLERRLCVLFCESLTGLVKHKQLLLCLQQNFAESSSMVHPGPWVGEGSPKDKGQEGVGQEEQEFSLRGVWDSSGSPPPVFQGAKILFFFFPYHP